MTIQFLISTEGSFGAENMLLTLAAALERRGCRSIVTIFRDTRHPECEELAARARDLGLHVEMLDCAGKIDLGAVFRLRKVIARLHTDVLHCHGYKADVYGSLAAWQTGAVLVSTCHNWPDPSTRMRAYAKLDRLVLRKFNRVVAVSPEVVKLLVQSGVPRFIVDEVFNGVEVERFRSTKPVLRRDTEQRECVIGYVGRLTPEKGGAVLLTAAEQLLRLRPNVRFVFVGDGRARVQWEELTRSLGISERIEFLGVRSDVPQIYASIDLLVLPSFAEGMPMCLLEAMAAGKAVIATSVGDVARIIVPGETGLLIPPGDPKALCSAMLRLVDDKELRARFAEAGHKRVKERFSADSMATSYLSIYSGAMQAAQPALRPGLEFHE